MPNFGRASLAISFRLVFALVLTSLAALACQSTPATPAPSAAAWAVVDGREITRDDVERAYQQNNQASQPLSEEEALAARLAVLDDLIAQDLLLAEARELKIEVPTAELDTAYLEARKDIPDEAFKQELAKRNLTAADMREGLRRDMLIQKLLTREVTSKVSVTEQEIAAFYEANKAQFNRTEDAYRVAQILITPVKEPQITNRTGNDATNAQEAKAKLDMVMERLKAQTDFSEVAADFSEDPETAPRGGDLGFLPVSNVQKLPTPLRDAVLKGTPGSARVVSGGGAHTVVVVLAKDPAGQKTLDSPGLKDFISQTLRERREQVLRAAYLSTLRNDSKIVNVIATRILESPAKMPSLLPGPSGAK